ncbi:MAG: outer membrane beta-barrel protein [Bacteroidales bacterium]
MDSKQLDKLFREKLDSYSTPVNGSDELWNSISSSLDNKVGAKKVFRRKVFYSVASIAAIVIAAYFLFAPNSQEPYIKDTNEESVLAQVQPIEKKQDYVAALTKTQTLIIKTSTEQPQDSTSSIIIKSLYVAEVGDSTITTVSKKNDVEDKKNKKVEQFSNFNNFDDLYKEEYPTANKTSRVTLALASNIISGDNINASPRALKEAMMASGGSVTPNGIPSIEQVSEAKYSLPLNFGLQLQVKLNSFLSVGVGVNYTMLRSKYDGLINKKMHSVKQTLHYIGVPINFYGTILQKKGFSLYANVGGSIEKGVRAVYKIKSYDNQGDYNSSIKGVQGSINAGIGVEYQFVKYMGIYLEPNAVYFFNSKISNSIRTDQPFQLKAEIGFRFHL